MPRVKHTVPKGKGPRTWEQRRAELLEERRAREQHIGTRRWSMRKAAQEAWVSANIPSDFVKCKRRRVEEEHDDSDATSTDKDVGGGQTEVGDNLSSKGASADTFDQIDRFQAEDGVGSSAAAAAKRRGKTVVIDDDEDEGDSGEASRKSDGEEDQAGDRDDGVDKGVDRDQAGERDDGAGDGVDKEGDEDDEEDVHPLDRLSIPQKVIDIDVSTFRFKTWLSRFESFNAKISVRSSVKKFYDFKTKLAKLGLEKMFRRSVFGDFLNLSENWTFNGQLVHSVLLRIIRQSKKKHEMWFLIDSKPVCFGLREFYLMTGLNCCEEPDTKLKAKFLTNGEGFLEKVCGGGDVRAENLLYLMEQRQFSKEEKLKLALLWFLHTVLMARDKTKNVEKWWIQCVDNLDFFSKYPWGRLCYDLTVDYLYNKVDFAKTHRQHVEGKTAGYALFGFPWAFLAWIYEAVPLVGRNAGKSEQSPLLIPRMLRWQHTRRNVGDVDAGHQGSRQVLHPFLIPTVQEVEGCKKFVSPHADEVEDPALDKVRAMLEGVTGIKYIVEEYADEMHKTESQEDRVDDVDDGDDAVAGDGVDGGSRGTCRHCGHVQGVLTRMLEVSEEILKLLKEKKVNSERKTKSRNLMKMKLFKQRKLVKRKKKVEVNEGNNDEEKNEYVRENNAAVDEEEEVFHDAQVHGADEEMTADAADAEDARNAAQVDGVDEEKSEEGDNAEIVEEARNEEIVEENRETQAALHVDEANIVVNEVLASLNVQFPSENIGTDNV